MAQALLLGPGVMADHHLGGTTPARSIPHPALPADGSSDVRVDVGHEERQLIGVERPQEQATTIGQRHDRANPHAGPPLGAGQDRDEERTAPRPPGIHTAAAQHPAHDLDQRLAPETAHSTGHALQDGNAGPPACNQGGQHPRGTSSPRSGEPRPAGRRSLRRRPNARTPERQGCAERVSLRTVDL